MNDELRKDFEEGDRGLTKITDIKRQSIQPVSRPSYETSTS
jgi:hypothetical protein